MTMRTIAKAGEAIHPAVVRRISRFTGQPLPEKVQPRHDHNLGGYICIDCPDAKVMQASILAKIHAKEHRIAWWNGRTIEEA